MTYDTSRRVGEEARTAALRPRGGTYTSETSTLHALLLSFISPWPAVSSDLVAGLVTISQRERALPYSYDKVEE
jgi:hypothetical protein